MDNVAIMTLDRPSNFTMTDDREMSTFVFTTAAIDGQTGIPTILKGSGSVIVGTESGPRSLPLQIMATGLQIGGTSNDTLIFIVTAATRLTVDHDSSGVVRNGNLVERAAIRVTGHATLSISPCTDFIGSTLDDYAVIEANATLSFDDDAGTSCANSIDQPTIVCTEIINSGTIIHTYNGVIDLWSNLTILGEGRLMVQSSGASWNSTTGRGIIWNNGTVDMSIMDGTLNTVHVYNSGIMMTGYIYVASPARWSNAKRWQLYGQLSIQNGAQFTMISTNGATLVLMYDNGADVVPYLPQLIMTSTTPYSLQLISPPSPIIISIPIGSSWPVGVSSQFIVIQTTGLVGKVVPFYATLTDIVSETRGQVASATTTPITSSTDGLVFNFTRTYADGFCPGGAYYHTTTKTCRLCPTGSWKAGLNGDTSCQLCPVDGGDNSLGGVLTSLLDCRCSAGHFLSTSGFGTCYSCPISTYMNVSNSLQQCIPCPDFSECSSGCTQGQISPIQCNPSSTSAVHYHSFLILYSFPKW
jgi:hypothetical protein